MNDIEWAKSAVFARLMGFKSLDTQQLFKGYCRLSKDRKLDTPELIETFFVSYYDAEGKVASDQFVYHGSIRIDFEKMGGRVVSRLRAWDDAWAVLASVPELLMLMGRERQKLTPDALEDFMRSQGYVEHRAGPLKADLLPQPSRRRRAKKVVDDQTDSA